MDKEYIICAAIWFNDGIDTYAHQPLNIKTGFVVCGHRHHNCFTIVAMLQGLKKKKNNNDEIQGFLTNSNRFVDRVEARKIAFEAGQLAGRNVHSRTELYSEDLY